MKEITIAVTDKVYQSLSDQCHLANAANHTDLTMEEWFLSLMEDTAIAPELGKAIAARRQQIEDEQIAVTQAHVADVRRELLASIRKDG